MDLTWIAKARPTLPVGAEELAWFREEIGRINSDTTASVEKRRENAENARFCKWAGQSVDARKYRDNLGKEPFPFEGCSDQRVPLVDMIVNEDVALCFLAGLNALMNPTVRMTEATDAAKSAYLEQVLRWELQTQIGVEAVREMLLLLNYMFGDVPGVGVLKTTWERDAAVVLESLSLEQVAEQLDELAKGATHPDTGETAGVFLARALQTPGLMEEGAELLGALLAPMGVDAAEARKMATELGLKGRTDFPLPFDRKDRVVLQALRPWEEVWFDGTARNEEQVEIWFEPTWLSRRGCRARAKEEKWSEEFLKALCGEGDEKGKPGMSAFGAQFGATSVLSTEYAYGTLKGRETEYEVLRCYFVATDKRGRTAWYETTLAAAVDGAAYDARLVNLKHGAAPFQVFHSEFLRSNMLDVRGVPSRMTPFQWALKLEVDMHNDRTQLGTVPPMIGPEGRAGKFRLQPGGYVPEFRAGEFRFMPLPAGGARDAEAHMAMLWRMVNEYSGRSGQDVPEDVVTLLRQAKVTTFLGQLATTLKRVTQLCCQFLTPERTMRLLNVAEDPLPRTVQEIQGSYDCTMWVDVRDLTDAEHLQGMAKIMVEAIVQLDRDGTINTTPWAQALAQRLDPRLAAMSVMGPEAAIDKEREEEKGAFVAIAGGVQPKLLEGVNYNFLERLQTLQYLVSENQEDISTNWTDRKRKVLEDHKKNLTQGLQQQENARTGKTGVKGE